MRSSRISDSRQGAKVREFLKKLPTLHLPIPQKTRPMNNSAIVLFAEAWKTAPIKKEVPAIIMDLYDGRPRRLMIDIAEEKGMANNRRLN